MRPLAAHGHLGLGKLYRRIGRFDEARAELSTAIKLFRAMGMTFSLPEAGCRAGAGAMTIPDTVLTTLTCRAQLVL